MRKLSLSAIASVILLSCGGGAPHSSSVISGKDSSLTNLAWKLHNDGVPADSFISVQQRAVEQMRRGQSADDPVAVLEQMGFFYYIIGEYGDALNFYLEASDSLRSHPERPRGEGTIQFFGDLSLLYGQLGLMDEAYEYSDSALAESRRQGGIMLSDIYKFRSVFYQSEGRIAEAMRCYDMAIDAIDRYRTNADKEMLRARTNGEKAYFMLETYKDNPDSVRRAVAMLENSLRYEGGDSAAHYFSLGLGYSLLGRHKEGLGMMEKMLGEFREQDDIEMLSYALNALMEEYARLRMWDKVGDVFPEYDAVRDSVFRARSDANAIGASVRFRSEVQKARNEQLRRQLLAERREARMIVAIAVLASIILAIVMIALVRRYRRTARQNMQQECEIKALSDSHADVLDRVQSLEANLSARINGNVEILSTPQLIIGEAQGRFRRAFNVLFPNFISELRGEYPQLTANDELLCMLLYLRHTTEEVSVYMGISRASVNSARYRLRRKFALGDSVSLDEFLTARRG